MAQDAGVQNAGVWDAGGAKYCLPGNAVGLHPRKRHPSRMHLRQQAWGQFSVQSKLVTA